MRLPTLQRSAAPVMEDHRAVKNDSVALCAVASAHAAPVALAPRRGMRARRVRPRRSDPALDGDGDGFCADDCDDSDPFTFPGQPAFFTSPRRAGGYDYNCDGVEELRDATPDCDDDGAGTCTGYRWAIIVPSCGSIAPGAECTGAVPMCSSAVSDREQACR